MEFFDTLFLMFIIIGGLSSMLVLFNVICLIILHKFPTSKVSSFIRDHIITDCDLEN